MEIKFIARKAGNVEVIATVDSQSVPGQGDTLFFHQGEETLKYLVTQRDWHYSAGALGFIDSEVDAWVWVQKLW